MTKSLILFFNFSSLENSGRIKYLILLLLLGTLAPYLYISFFSSAAADDFCYAVVSSRFSVWENFTHLYIRSGGRYVTNTLVLFDPLVFNSAMAYKLVPVLMILLSIGSAFYFIRSLSSCIVSGINALNISILFVLLYLYQMPSLAEGIYFYTSAVAYHFSLITVVLYFALLYEYHRGKLILNRFIHVFLLLVTLIVSLGCNEGLTLVLICFHMAIIFLFLQQKKKIGADWILIVSVCTLFAGIMLLAPGNSVRATNYPEGHNLLRSFLFTGMQMMRFGFDWISSLPLILSSLLLAGIVNSHKESMPFFRQNNFFHPLVSVLLLCLILFLNIFPAYWSTNILGQYRTVNVACFLFFLYWFVCIGIYSGAYLEKMKLDIFSRPRIQMLSIAIILCTVSATHNGYTVFTDILYGKVNAFDRQMKERSELLSKEENKQAVVHLTPIEEAPRSLEVLELSEDSVFWGNRCQAKYFGVKSIVCRK